jgi:hypothetical protein
MRAVILLYMCASVISPFAYAQKSGNFDGRVSHVLDRMASSDLKTREAAFDDMLDIIAEGQLRPERVDYKHALDAFFKRHPDQTDRVKLGLLDVLRADNDTFMHPDASQKNFTESDSEHYAEAINVVSSLDDERAIPVLVGAISTGKMAMGGILKFGQKALDPVLAQLGNPNPEIRSSAITVGITILRMKNDPASRSRIVEIIRTAITDQEYLARSSGLRAIEGLDDRKQFLPALKEMAEHDPFIVPGETVYPLRVRAQRLIDKISN